MAEWRNTRREQVGVATSPPQPHPAELLPTVDPSPISHPEPLTSPLALVIYQPQFIFTITPTALEKGWLRAGESRHRESPFLKPLELSRIDKNDAKATLCQSHPKSHSPGSSMHGQHSRLLCEFCGKIILCRPAAIESRFDPCVDPHILQSCGTIRGLESVSLGTLQY